jgi:large subunit ribosomal protein L21
MRYAVVESGGKQYFAREGETLEVDRIEAEPGKTVELKDVLLIVDGSQIQVGTPLIEGAHVAATVVDQVKAPKILVFRYIPKERVRRRKGHRQQYTRLAIGSIAAPGMASPPDQAQTAAPRKAASKPKAKKAATKKTAAKKPAAKKASKE